MIFHNPFAFRPAQVTFWTTAIYVALLCPLIYIHENVPKAPQDSALPLGLSLSEAWQDLANLTQEYHPFNSHANDAVRDWLLLRLQRILDENSASWSTDRGCTGWVPLPGPLRTSLTPLAGRDPHPTRRESLRPTLLSSTTAALL